MDVPPVDLQTQLPNLPDAPTTPAVSHSPPEEVANTPLDLIYRLLLYPPERRLRADEARLHRWLSGETLLLPLDCAGTTLLESRPEWKGQSLGDIWITYL